MARAGLLKFPFLMNSPLPKKRGDEEPPPLETKKILNHVFIFSGPSLLISQRRPDRHWCLIDWEGEICLRRTAHLHTGSLFGCLAPSPSSAKWPLSGMSHSATQLTSIPIAGLWNPAEDFWVRSFFYGCRIPLLKEMFVSFSAENKSDNFIHIPGF